jgi:hypothetical protein
MTAQQTSVAAQSFAIAGTLADGAPKYQRSYVNEAAAELPFGCAAKLGTDPDAQVAVPTAQANIIAGVTVHSHAYAKDVELGTNGVKTSVPIGVLKNGVIRVYSSEAIVVGTSAVRIRIDTNAGTDNLLGPGTFCKSSSAGHTILVTSGMKWVKGCGAGGVAELSVCMDAFAKTDD